MSSADAPGQVALITTTGYSTLGSSWVLMRSAAHRPERIIMIITRLDATRWFVNKPMIVFDALKTDSLGKTAELNY